MKLRSSADVDPVDILSRLSSGANLTATAAVLTFLCVHIQYRHRGSDVNGALQTAKIEDLPCQRRRRSAPPTRNRQDTHCSLLLMVSGMLCKAVVKSFCSGGFDLPSFSYISFSTPFSSPNPAKEFGGSCVLLICQVKKFLEHFWEGVEPVTSPLL